MEDSRFTCFYDNYWDCKLPVSGSEQSAFLTMGFEFGSFSDEDKFRDVKLPSGWRLEDIDKKHWGHILDDRNRVRAKVFTLSTKPFMYPERRFSWGKLDDDISVTFHVWDHDHEVGETSDSIFKRRFVLPDRKRFKNAYDQKIKAYVQNSICEEWLDETFPRWNDYCAYWYEGKVTLDINTLKVIMVKEGDIFNSTEKDSENI